MQLAEWRHFDRYVTGGMTVVADDDLRQAMGVNNLCNEQMR